MDGIHVLSGFLDDGSVTGGSLTQVHFADDFWKSTSAVILRLQQGPEPNSGQGAWQR